MDLTTSYRKHTHTHTHTNIPRSVGPVVASGSTNYETVTRIHEKKMLHNTRVWPNACGGGEGAGWQIRRKTDTEKCLYAAEGQIDFRMNNLSCRHFSASLLEMWPFGRSKKKLILFPLNLITVA